jgi:hypothetical protein
MASEIRDRTGVLVVRVWIEGDSTAGVRARITRTVDIGSREDAVSIASSVEEIRAIVEAWLEEFVSG